MKAVIPEVPEFILEWRRRTGNDRWDEMWEGVLHMAPAPSRKHQQLQGQLYTWLDAYWARPHGNEVDPPINVAPVGGWPDDYRIPDLVLLTPDRFHVIREAYLEGAPTAVVEIQSPGDETVEKLAFYAELGVPEVWIIDRDTRVPQVFRLVGGNYEEQQPDSDGWLRSALTGVLLRGEPSGRLAVQMANQPETYRLLPED